MKKRMLALLLGLTMAFSLVACGGNDTKETSEPEKTEEGEAEATDKDELETNVIRWARGNSGNILVTVARKNGYLDDVGLTIEETPIDNTADGFTAMMAHQVDVCSNYGTNNPLQYIAAGEEVTIFGGHMLTGCMPIIAKKGTEWNGIEDFIGKTVAGPATTYAASGPLLDKGHDPLNDVEWLNLPGQSDRVAAVESGEADYGIIGTGQMYSILNMDDIDILCYLSDITPNYSCCRMETRTDFIEENPNTVKALLKALIRAQSYYESHKEECVSMLAEELDTSEDYVAAYMLNEHYRINVDPLKKSVVRAWDYLDAMGFLDENAKEVNIEDHVNTELYKAALDEVMAEHYDEDPEFYDAQVAFFEENN